MRAPPSLAELEAGDRRELGVLDTGLTALEVLQVDLGDLDAAVPHEPREAIDFATALQPRARKGVTELVRCHRDIGNACRLLYTL